MATGLTGFSNEIRNEQLMGTLELVFLSPTRLITILFCSSVWNFLFSSIYAEVTIGIAATVFELSPAHVNLLAAFIMLVLTVLAMMGMGIISAGIIMVTKAGDPVNWVFGALSLLLSGVYYPVEILPSALRGVSAILPLTYGLEGMRLALMTGTPITSLIDKVGILLVFIWVAWPLGYLVFRKGSTRQGWKEASHNIETQQVDCCC
jgi:ABC-2 type transport system permease protein